MFWFYCFTFSWTLAIITDVLADSLTSKQFVLYTTKRSWNEARTICKDAGGRLAMSDNKATQEALWAYHRHPNSVWTNDLNDDIWIGLNKDPYSNDNGFRWDHCEPVGFLSFTDWGESQPTNPQTSHCVAAGKDTLKWRTFDCNNELKFLCEVNSGEATICDLSEDRPHCLSSDNELFTLYRCSEFTLYRCSLEFSGDGPCRYTFATGVCPWATYQDTYNVDVFQCKDKCSTELYNDLACWMYSHDGETCTLNFDADPDKCSPPVAGEDSAGIRTCFTYALITSASTAPQTDSVPIIDCNMYTAQELTTGNPATDSTSDSTTDPTTHQTTDPKPNLTTFNTTSISETTTTPMPTTIATETTTTTTATTSTTTDLTTDETTTFLLTTTGSLTSASSQPVTNTKSYPATTSVTTTTTQPSSLPIKTTFTTTESTSLPIKITFTTTQSTTSTLTTTTFKPTTTSAVTTTSNDTTTTATTTTPNTTTTTSVTDSAGSSGPPGVVVSSSTTAKSVMEIQELVDALLLKMKVDTTKLSATRRKKQSVPDERPSAQAIGWSGIVFLVICFSFFAIIDITRFVKFASDKGRR